MNVENLIKSCIKQNRQAQEELYHLYKKTLFVLRLKYCANEAEAEMLLLGINYLFLNNNDVSAITDNGSKFKIGKTEDLTAKTLWLNF